MTTIEWHDEVTLEIAAEPGHLWELIADVTRMGEWSPVCRRCEWADGSASAAVGSHFVGHNRQGPVRWSRRCEVTVSNPGHELSFRTFFKGRKRLAGTTAWRRQRRAPASSSPTRSSPCPGGFNCCIACRACTPRRGATVFAAWPTPFNASAPM